jgi:cold shock CspA family protein
MPTGKIVWFDPHKLAYGFIKGEGDIAGRDVFIHRAQVSCDPTALIPDTPVSFTLVVTHDGRLRAQDVRLVNAAPDHQSSESFSDVVDHCNSCRRTGEPS